MTKRKDSKKGKISTSRLSQNYSNKNVKIANDSLPFCYWLNLFTLFTLVDKRFQGYFN